MGISFLDNIKYLNAVFVKDNVLKLAPFSVSFVIAYPKKMVFGQILV